MTTDQLPVTAPTATGHEPTSCWTRYVFSTDHKTIAKQFLLTGMAWAVIGGGASMLIRLQLGFPSLHLPILHALLGRYTSESGQLTPTATWGWCRCTGLL